MEVVYWCGNYFSLLRAKKRKKNSEVTELFVGAGSMSRLSSAVYSFSSCRILIRGWFLGKPCLTHSNLCAAAIAGLCLQLLEPADPQPAFIYPAWMAGTHWCKHCRNHQVFQHKTSGSRCSFELAFCRTVSTNLLWLPLVLGWCSLALRVSGLLELISLASCERLLFLSG